MKNNHVCAINVCIFRFCECSVHKSSIIINSLFFLAFALLSQLSKSLQNVSANVFTLNIVCIKRGEM